MRPRISKPKPRIDFQPRWPEPSALPADAKRAGGSAVVAGRTAKNAAVCQSGLVVWQRRGTRRAASGLDSVRGLADRVRDETDSSRRELKARYLEATEGRAAATDSLLDARSSMVDGRWRWCPAADEDPHRSVPDPIVTAGREPVAEAHRRGPDASRLPPGPQTLGLRANPRGG